MGTLHKILAFADIHTNMLGSSEIQKMKAIVNRGKPDIVLIAGDIFESSVTFNPYKELAKLGKPVVFCLGNHEFAYRSVEDTLKFYQDYYNPEKYDVHCLDVLGSHKIDNLNFIGNVLWYDGSFKDILSQSDSEIIDGWLDKTIVNFDFHAENAKCQQQIEENYDPNYKNILLTHCCPDVHLNAHVQDGPSLYNYYSGMNLLTRLYDEKKELSMCICGHTHRYASSMIGGVLSVNIGNDYYFRTHEMKHMGFYV